MTCTLSDEQTTTVTIALEDLIRSYRKQMDGCISLSVSAPAMGELAARWAEWVRQAEQCYRTVTAGRGIRDCLPATAVTPLSPAEQVRRFGNPYETHPAQMRLPEPCPDCDGHGEHGTRDPQQTTCCPLCAGSGIDPFTTLIGVS